MNETENIRLMGQIADLKPAFNGYSGWIWCVELNLIDPRGDRFVIIDEAIFEDGTVFLDILSAEI